MKIINFEKCNECKFFKNDQDDTPCDDCLAIPVREDSVTPLYFERGENNHEKRNIR